MSEVQLTLSCHTSRCVGGLGGARSLPAVLSREEVLRAEGCQEQMPNDGLIHEVTGSAACCCGRRAAT